MKAIKANKQYTIDETAKASYLAQGFDITDDSGVIIEHSPQSTVPYSRFESLAKENEVIKAENEKLKAENKKLEAEAKKKKGEV